MCQAWAVECNELKEPSTMKITTVGLDIAKRVFQLHGVDAAGKAVLRRKLQRSEVLAFFKALPPCLVGIEACGTAHYWAREIRELGHEVRLMPPSYVAPYVKRGKTDAGKQRQGGISKQDDRYLRRLLVLGATAVIRHSRSKIHSRGRLAQKPARAPARTARLGGTG
jgi:transposase